MAQYKFPWPERFECHRLPEKSTDEQLCMDPQEQSQQEQDSMTGPGMLGPGDGGIPTGMFGGSGRGISSTQEPELQDHGLHGDDVVGQCSCRKCQNG